jgi:hypothetical protein
VAIIETVVFSKVGHIFGLPPGSGKPPPYLVGDFLLDQTGWSGCDGKMTIKKLFDLTKTTSYQFNIFPEGGREIVVDVPPFTNVFMELKVGREFVKAVAGGGGTADVYLANSFFLTSQAQPNLASGYSISQNTNDTVSFDIEAEVNSPIRFSGFTTIGTYPARTFDPGTKDYFPKITPNTDGYAPYLMFGYYTSSPIDPGPFVFLK